MSAEALVLAAVYTLTALGQQRLERKRTEALIDNLPDVPQEVKDTVKAHVQAAGDRWRAAAGPDG